MEFLKPLWHLPAAGDFSNSSCIRMAEKSRYLWRHLMRCKISRCALYALDGQALLLLSASPFTSMMQELTKCVVIARMCMSELHEVPLQAEYARHFDTGVKWRPFSYKRPCRGHAFPRWRETDYWNDEHVHSCWYEESTEGVPWFGMCHLVAFCSAAVCHYARCPSAKSNVTIALNCK